MSSCIFCKIINKEVPADFVEEKENFIVIRDIAPKAPIHWLLISKKHINSLLHLTEADKNLLGEMIYETKVLAEKERLTASGYRVIINCGTNAGQIVPHLHLHFLAGGKITDMG